MNLIKNIEIKNFKSIRHQKIDDCKRINVLVGYPNTGKSNILEALSLFSIDRPDTDFSSFVRVEELPTLFFDGNVIDEVKISINGNNIMYASILELDKIHFAWRLNKPVNSSKETPENIHDVYGILDFSKVEGDDKIKDWDSIFHRLPRHPDFKKELEGYVAPVKKYSFQKNVMYSSGKYDSLLIPNGENIFDLIRTRSDLRKEIANLFEGYNLKLLYNSAERKFSILKDISKDAIFSIPYGLISDTLQRLVFYKVAIASNKDSILLFEEPEAHMFPPYISKLSSDIWYNKDNQYFISTHSPFVVNDFLENAREELAVYVVEYKKDTGETIIKRLTDEQLHEAYQYGIDIFFNLESITE